MADRVVITTTNINTQKELKPKNCWNSKFLSLEARVPIFLHLKLDNAILKYSNVTLAGQRTDCRQQITKTLQLQRTTQKVHISGTYRSKFSRSELTAFSSGDR